MPRTKLTKATKTVIKPKIKKSGLTIDVLDAEGKAVDKVELPREIFAAKVNDKLLAQAVRVYLANQRQGTLSTKTRGEVAGSTRKIYRQKGTGRARHGSIKAPIFVGGGITFGPKPRDFGLKLSQKMRTRALISALAGKFQAKDLMVLKISQKFPGQTKEMVKIFKQLELAKKDGTLSSKILLLTHKDQETLVRACRNLQDLTVKPVQLLNPYLLLSHQKIIFTQKALEEFKVLWTKPKS